MPLFSKKSSNTSRVTPPITADAPGADEYFEAFVKPHLQNRRLFVATLGLFFTVIGLVIAIIAMLPLKTVVPYVIRINSNGAASVDPVGAEKYTAGKPEIRASVAKWVIKSMTIDPYLSEKHYLPEAYQQTVGKARDEFLDWVNEDQKTVKRIEEDDSLTRSVKVSSAPAFVGDDPVLIVRFSTEERSMRSTPKVKRWVATIHYTIIPPKTDEEILSNPTGVFVSHFEFRDDLEQ